MKIWITPIICLLVLAGCSTTMEVKKYKFNEDSLSSGVLFYLPKTEVWIDFKYAIYEDIVWNVDNEGKKTDKKSTTYKAQIDDPIILTSKVVADYDNSFVIDLDSIESGFKETELTIDLSKSGYLTGINAKSTDKAAEAIKSTVQALGNIAKIAAIAGGVVLESKKIQEIPVSRRVGLDSLLNSCNNNTCDYPVDVSSLNVELRSCVGISNASECRVSDKMFPAVNASFLLDEDASVLNTNLSKKNLILENKVSTLDGIPYRLARHVTAQISVDGHMAGNTNIPILQLGDIAYIPINSKIFESNSRKLTFDANTGALTKLESKSDANASQGLEALNKGTSELVTALEAMQTYEQEREKAILTADKDVITAEKDIIDAKGALELEPISIELELLKKQKEVADAQEQLAKLEEIKDVDSYAFKLQKIKAALEFKKAENELTTEQAKADQTPSEEDKLKAELEILKLKLQIIEAKEKLKKAEE
ncbi:hypothetical protein [Pseudoalteromonas sp. OF7H-1]|uniref:hypothetical protein n=1 Tax=Pseudoalteromonas sp. OF7H-1 TaxID=2917755 RepID=UPI001EF5EA04|nr:hypothetical protein [Pseudoalteromonas sp. OF7H-1]MCG7540951.1 hypothetical protein [Pseudoalteromonas sp. OF7H-1]